MTAADPVGIDRFPDRTEEYLSRDLDAEGVWPGSAKGRYGGVVFNAHGEMLLREPTNHYDGYVWTFPKGAPEKGETTAETALREVFEETGRRPRIVGHLDRGFSGTSTGWVAYYYLMVDVVGTVDEGAIAANAETAMLRWADQEDAASLISMTTNFSGRRRDLEVLDAAFGELERLLSARSDGSAKEVG